MDRNRPRRRPPADALAPLGSAVLLAAVLGASAGGEVVVVPPEARPDAAPPPPAEPAPPQTPVAAPEAAPFQPPTGPSAVRRTLRQFEALVADKAWDEAIDLIEQLQAESGDDWIEAEASDGASAFTTIAKRCQAALAALPPEGLEAYRLRVDPIAERWLDEGTRRLDRRLLRRVVDELAASSSAGRALLALGDMQLESGDTAGARRRWGRLSPLLRGPLGDPADAALAGVRVDIDGPTLAAAWTGTERPAGRARLPATDIAIADLLTRMVVASVRDGDQRRARDELRLLEALAPEAEGRLAGRVQRLAPALRKMIDASESATSRVVGPARSWLWPKPLAVTAPIDPQRQAFAQRLARQQMMARRLQLANQPALAGRININAFATAPQAPPTPIAASATRLVLVDQQGLRQVDVATGESAPVDFPGAKPPAPAPLLANEQVFARGGMRIVVRGGQVQLNGGRVVTNNLFGQGTAPSVAPESIVLAGDTLLAVRSVVTMERDARRRARRVTRDTLVGLDLTSEAKLLVEIAGDKIEDGRRFRFAGRPAVRGDRLFAVLHEEGLGARVSIACFDRRGGRPIWRTELGSGQPVTGAPITAVGRRGPGPSVVGATVYVPTDLGAIAAVEASTGRFLWLTRYARRAAGGPAAAPAPAPCVVRGDRLFAAPTDSPHLLALDTADGRVLWRAEPPGAEAAIAGVVGDTVVVAGRRVVCHDVATGQRRWAWPESDHAGIRGRGRALLAGAELFWPTRDAVHVIDATTGAFARQPIELAPVSTDGANLYLAGDRLVVAGPKKISVLGNLPRSAPELPPALSRLKRLEAAGGATLATK